ncbi:MAG: thioredoxin family protein [Candidatus Eremiobacteraeota bacterium]|nr:thioredoxin family protein [Candidatus Eremiobacteraeota bacterium]
MKKQLFLSALLLCSALISAESTPSPNPSFAPLDKWRVAVQSGDAAKLKSLYSDSAKIQNPKKEPITLADDVHFWTAARKGLSLELAPVEPPKEGVQYVKFEAQVAPSAAERPHYILVIQGWQAGDNPRIVFEQHTPLLALKQPIRFNPKLYDTNADAQQEINDALARAAKEHKRVILVFGGNWCYDCHVLDLAFHQPNIEPTVDAHYIVVHVDVGQYDKNLDVAKKYGVPLDKGVPNLAVLSSDGSVVFSQKGEFESARSLTPEAILAFLDKWKG